MPAHLKCIFVGIPSMSFPGDSYLPGEVEAIDPAALQTFTSVPDGLDLVVAPLFGQEIDALEILEQLAGLGYRGTLLVIAPRLPNHQIVLRELRTHAARQGILVELVEQDAGKS